MIFLVCILFLFISLYSRDYHRVQFLGLVCCYKLHLSNLWFHYNSKIAKYITVVEYIISLFPLLIVSYRHIPLNFKWVKFSWLSNSKCSLTIKYCYVFLCIVMHICTCTFIVVPVKQRVSILMRQLIILKYHHSGSHTSKSSAALIWRKKSFSWAKR